MKKASFPIQCCLFLALAGCIAVISYKPAKAANCETGAVGPMSLRCSVSKSIPQLGRGSGSGINAVDDRLEIVGIRAIDVFSFIYGVREKEIGHVGMPLNYPIDAMLEGVRDQSVQLEVLRSVVPAALGIAVETGSATVAGYMLSRQKEPAAKPSAIAEGEGECAVFNGELRATRASGAQICAALNASGEAPVMWSGDDTEKYTLTMSAREDQEAVIDQVCAACRLTVERGNISVRTIKLTKRP